MRNFANVVRNIANSVLSADNTAAQMRLNHRGEQITSPQGALGFALEGSLFTAITPTLGTGMIITTATQTAFSATSPAIMIRNTNQAGGADLILRKLRLIVTGAGTGLTSLESAAVVDTANRYSSGGTLAAEVAASNGLQVANIRPDRPATPGAQIRTSTNTSLVASAAGASARIHSRQKLRTGIPVIGDHISIVYGAEPAPEFGPLSGTAAQILQQGGPAVVIPPQCDFLFYLWGPGMTAAPTFEIALVLAER